jgi:CHASE2 domain-containing sensor protein
LLGSKYTNLFGWVNLEEDPDGTIRRARRFYIDKSGGARPSFAGRAVDAAFPGRLKLAYDTQPMWIDYAVNLRSLTPVSWKEVSGLLSATPGVFRGRLVIAGATYGGSGDEHPVPGILSDKKLPGQYVQALIVNTVLAGNPIRDVPLSRCLAAVGLACLAATVAALCFPHYYAVSLVFSVVLLCGYLCLAFSMFRSSRAMIAVLGPELAILLSMSAAWGLKSQLSAYPAAER